MSTAELASRLRELEGLVDELIKAVPSQVKVQTCMENVGLRYVVDPIEQMTQVLSELDRIRVHSYGALKEKV